MDLVIYGLINTATLCLMATGFALVYGVSRIPNFAHGALYVLAPCLTWVFLHKLSLPYVAAAVGGILGTGAAGVLIYLIVLKRVRGMPFSEIVATLAISMGTLEGFRVLGLVGPRYALPQFAQGTTDLLGVTVGWHRVIVVAAAAGVVFLLWALTHHTRIGRGLRAVAQDEPAALTLGIDNDLYSCISMGAASVLVGLAGVVLVPLGTLTVESGYEVLILSLAVCIVGGLGSWSGAVFAAFLIGFSQVVTVRLLAPHWHLVVALLAIIGTLILCPSGLLGRQKELEERT